MNFARVYVSCFHTLVLSVRLRARVCVLPYEMECVIFYSRKIAHRANVICCIMYPTLIDFFSYLILSYLISSHLISSHLHLISSHLISSHLISSHLISSHLIFISSHLISSHLISSHLISSYLISSHLILSCHWSHLISSHLILSYLVIDSYNGMSPVRRQGIVWTNAELLSIGPLGTNFGQVVKFKYFHSRKYIWKYRQKNVGHFVSVWIW